jgi:hypothetical protein
MDFCSVNKEWSIGGKGSEAWERAKEEEEERYSGFATHIVRVPLIFMLYRTLEKLIY